jgi:hypothetical protein
LLLYSDRKQIDYFGCHFKREHGQLDDVYRCQSHISDSDFEDRIKRKGKKDWFLYSFEQRLALKYLYRRDQNSGGRIRSSHGEVWTYKSDGSVKNEMGVPGIEYAWTSEFFLPLPSKFSLEKIQALGLGRWNGVWATWHENMNKDEATITYFWDPIASEYQTQDPTLNWKWNAKTNTLSSATGGDWTVEGNVPHPVVFFLQLMRYYRNLFQN